MSRKLVLLPSAVATAQSLATAFTTTPTVLSYQDNVAYQINVTTSDSEGAFEVQASMDYVPSGTGSVPPNAGTWATLTMDGTPTAAAANDVIAVSLNQVPFKALRISYTPTVAGTGTCDILIMARTVGA